MITCKVVLKATGISFILLTGFYSGIWNTWLVLEVGIRSLQNTRHFVDDAKRIGLRILIFFFCISWNLVIIYMLIIQNFNISMHLIKPHLKNQRLSLLLQTINGVWILGGDFAEGKESLVGKTPVKPLVKFQLYCEV